MWRVALLLIFALIIIPVFSYYFDAPIVEPQLSSLKYLFCSMLIVAGVCFLIGELTVNVSQVDKIWSIVPIFYAFKVFMDSGYHPRLGLMFVLVLIWGIRLT